MSTGYNKALGFWTVGIQYLHLVQAVSNETYSQGNPHILLSDEPLSLKEYDEKTKWSDHRLVIPLLFNFYHGLEVILKGFLCAKDPTARLSHKLSQLLADFKLKYQDADSDLIKIFEKYIDPHYLPTVLSDFLKTSGISIDDYYQALKYAEGTGGNQFQHHPLKYRGEDGKEFFSNLRNDIELLRRMIVSLGRQECPNA